MLLQEAAAAPQPATTRQPARSSPAARGKINIQEVCSFVFLRLHFVFPIILKHIQWRVLEISIL
jgi:hypothetical protein